MSALRSRRAAVRVTRVVSLLIPVEIRRLGTRALRVVWGDGHAGDYGNRYLRDRCPCAACRSRPHHALPVVGGDEELYPARIDLVGHYAVGIAWSDGHDSGIYSYQTLRALCPCTACTTAVRAAS